jgi:hypothetical protein
MYSVLYNTKSNNYNMYSVLYNTKSNNYNMYSVKFIKICIDLKKFWLKTTRIKKSIQIDSAHHSVGLLPYEMLVNFF